MIHAHTHRVFCACWQFQTWTLASGKFTISNSLNIYWRNVQKVLAHKRKLKESRRSFRIDWNDKIVGFIACQDLSFLLPIAENTFDCFAIDLKSINTKSKPLNNVCIQIVLNVCIFNDTQHILQLQSISNIRCQLTANGVVVNCYACLKRSETQCVCVCVCVTRWQARVQLHR